MDHRKGKIIVSARRKCWSRPGNFLRKAVSPLNFWVLMVLVDRDNSLAISPDDFPSKKYNDKTFLLPSGNSSSASYKCWYNSDRTTSSKGDSSTSEEDC